MNEVKAHQIAECIERWIIQRERLNRPNHNRCAKMSDDDYDYKAELITLLIDSNS